ncbi:MAG: 4Fe-4S dicluster domain-containing protein [Desulfosoma sp.]
MSTVIVAKEDLGRIFENLKAAFRVIGPVLEGDVVVLGELDDLARMPSGRRDRQGPGMYRLGDVTDSKIFSFSIGPDSFKRFLHPPLREEYTFKKSKKRLQIQAIPPSGHDMRTAFFGMRACDLAALKLLDKVFLKGPVQDNHYALLRQNAFIVAVPCVRPGDNCFCSSMHTGPDVRDGYDLSLTELDGFFVVETGSAEGKALLDGVPARPAGPDEEAQKAATLDRCRELMKKSINVRALPRVIDNNLDHPRWADIAARCLGCGNCTQVCPTCFCTTGYDHIPLSCLSRKTSERCGSRRRAWDSCFSINFARVHGGNFRPSRRARFRQWMAHKLAYWIHQFGTPGCVGCGRCITWCPVGIDLTQELEALSATRTAP